MRLRRGGRRFPTQEEQLIGLYQPGDIVCNLLHGDSSIFKGVVVSSDPKTKKITVKWGGGEPQQHSADEIILSINSKDDSEYSQLKDHSFKNAATTVKQMEKSEEYVGDPELLGVDKPRGGGFSIMQELVEDTSSNKTGNEVIAEINDCLFESDFIAEIDELLEAGALDRDEVNKMSKANLDDIQRQYEAETLPAVNSIRKMSEVLKNHAALKSEFKIYSNALKVLDKTELGSLNMGDK